MIKEIIFCGVDCYEILTSYKNKNGLKTSDLLGKL